MRILFVNSIIDRKIGGGTTERTIRLKEAMEVLEHECSIIGVDTGILHKEDLEDVILLSCLYKRFFVPSPTIRNYRLIRNAIDDADVVHIISHWTILNAIVFMLCKRQGKKYFVTPAGALTVFGRSKLIKHAYNWVIGRKIIRQAYKCIAISQNEVTEFGEYGIEKEKTFHLPNGVPSVNPDNYVGTEFSDKYHLPDTKYILFMGRINLIKGVDFLVEAFIKEIDNLNDFSLLIAGPDEGLRNELEAQIQKNDLAGRIIFLGYLNEEDKYRAYSSAEFLVVPSRMEAMSIVALEAGLFSLPVLVTDVCDLEDIAACQGGIIVRPDSPSIASGLIKMTSREDRKEMGEKIRDHVSRHYQWSVIAKKLESHFFEALS